MLSLKQNNVGIAAVIVVISIIFIAGQMEANAGKESLSSTKEAPTTLLTADVCCITGETKISEEKAKELTFGSTQCPSIPLTVTLTTINQQVQACLLYDKQNTLGHILNKSAVQEPLMPYKTKRIEAK